MQESRLKMCGQKDKLCFSQMSCGPSPFQFFLTEIYMAQEAGTWSQQEFAELYDDKSWLQLCHEPGMSQTLAEEMNKFLGKTHELQGEAFSPPLARPSPGLARVLKVHSLGCFNWIELRVCLRLWILMRFQDIFCIIFSALDRIKMK